MFPTYQEYYNDFLQKLSELSEYEQEKLISILKLRCESGIIPKYTYGDEDNYFDYTYKIPIELVEFIELFDSYFYPEELVSEETNSYSKLILEKFNEEVQNIKSYDLELIKKKTELFLIRIKNIVDKVNKSYENLINKVVINKRTEFENLLKLYYSNQITQEELDLCYTPEKIKSIKDLGYLYYNFLTNKFAKAGYEVYRDIDSYKKIIQSYNIVQSAELEEKIKKAEIIAEKYINVNKCIDIINWMVFSNEYKFVNEFQNKKKLLENNLFEFVENFTNLNDENDENDKNEIQSSLEMSLEQIYICSEILTNNILKSINLEEIFNIDKPLPEKMKLFESHIDNNMKLQEIRLIEEGNDIQLINAIKDLAYTNISFHKLDKNLDELEKTLRLYIKS